jgi:four helix bundle protein
VPERAKDNSTGQRPVALKEANECEYWTSLLRDSDFISQATSLDLITDNVEIIKMLTASIKTSKKNEQ